MTEHDHHVEAASGTACKVDVGPAASLLPRRCEGPAAARAPGGTAPVLALSGRGGGSSRSRGLLRVLREGSGARRERRPTGNIMKCDFFEISFLE
ncbi:unnamed protein product [Caretta caretta]